MSENLEDRIRRLSPSGLQSYKRQLLALPEEDRQRAFSRLSGIPELEDILGRPALRMPEREPAQPQRTLTREEETPFWQQALSTIGKPFQWIEEHVTQPFGAIVTSPWSPQVEGTEGMGWMERELAEYRAWDDPNWGFLGVKGVTEFLPWLLVPSAAGVAGRLGGIAARGGALGRGAALAGKAVRPVAAVEQAPVKLAGKVIGKVRGKPPITPPPPVAGKLTSELFPDGFTPPQQSSIEKLTELVKEAKPLRKETAEIQKIGRAKQATAYEAELERLAKEGVTPREALKEAEKALFVEGGLGEARAGAGFTSVGDKITEDMGQSLFEVIQNAPYKTAFDRINTRQALARLLDPAGAGLPRDFEFKLLEKTFGSDLIKQLLKKRPLGAKAREWALDLANAPRALLASCDISGLLRQGGVLTARHPLESAKTVRPMLKAIFSDKNAQVMDDIIRSRVGMDELLDTSLREVLFQGPLPTKMAAKMAEREEAFMSWLVNKFLPIKMSNRAYVTGLNDLRSRSALSVLNSWKKAGIKYTKDDISDLNQLVNWASGRGTLPKLIEKQGALLNTMLFSPRLIMSRLQLPTAILPMVTKSKLARWEAWRTLLSFVGAGAGILTMAKMSGASDIELDPRSADFGKMKVGNVRLDIWTGYLQYIRFATQLAAAQRKTTQTGRFVDLNRMEVIQRFAKTKFSPAVGLFADLLEGETYLGESLPPKSAKGIAGQAYNRMVPLAIQDLVDGVMQDGPLGGLVSSVGFVGVGVITYTDELRRARDKVAREKHGLTWEEVGQAYGRAEQLRMEQESPAILEAEKEQETRYAAGTPTAMEHFRSAGEEIEKGYREEADNAVRQFRATGDGVRFRERIDKAAHARRRAYANRAKQPEFQDIMAYYQQPLKPERIAEMNPGDVLRREYYQQMFDPIDMFDEFGEYRFDEAEKREQEFIKKFGQQALDYIETYSESRWLDKPAELRMLEEARDMLRPYWQITDAIWQMYPPQLQQMSEQIKLMERTDPDRARMLLKQYPQILRARELIARYRKQMRDTNPLINRAYRLFYG